MKITVYTTTDCQYSKQEREYLASNKLQYEEKNLETNKEFLTEMMAISNNFAGTPVTRVEKDDGAIVVLKGFTKGEFDTTFGLVETKPAETPIEAKPEIVTPVADAPIPQTPPTEVVPQEPKSEELNSVINKLENQSAPIATPPVETPPTEVPPVEPTPTDSTNPPSVPDLPDAIKTTA